MMNNFMYLLSFSALFVTVYGQLKHEEPQPIPQPYNFVYTAGRAPGHTDRVHAESSDGSGVVRGMFSYIDPRQELRTVEYVADQNGFHPLISNPVEETKAVQAARLKHEQLYHRIATEQARLAAERGGFEDDGSYKGEANYVHVETDHPRDTVAVHQAKAKHADLYHRIAADHQRIAAEREPLQHHQPINGFIY